MSQRNRKDIDLEVSDEDIPEDPGPAVAGKTPILGTVRRKNGIPVLRDELGEMVEGR